MIKITTGDVSVKYVCEWRIELPHEVYSKMLTFAQEMLPNECSGMGLVDVQRDGKCIIFKVLDICMPVGQRNTRSSTNLPVTALTPEYTNWVTQDPANCERIRLHWHSHAEMGVFHSGTDNENYDELRTGPWLVSLVINAKGELLGRVDYYDPFELHASNIPVYITMPALVHAPAWKEHAKAVRDADVPPPVDSQQYKLADYDDVGNYVSGTAWDKMTGKERFMYALKWDWIVTTKCKRFCELKHKDANHRLRVRFDQRGTGTQRALDCLLAELTGAWRVRKSDPTIGRATLQSIYYPHLEDVDIIVEEL